MAASTSQLNVAPARKIYAFTLVEIMLALGMLSLIMAALCGSYQAVTGSIDRVLPGLRTGRAAVLTLNQMCRQLRGCYARRMDRTVQRASDQVSLAERDERERMLEFSGESDGSLAKLRFITSQGRSRVAARHGQLCQVMYAWDRSEGRLLMARRPNVYRDIQDEEDLVWRCLLDSVLALELEFFDGEDWHSAWQEGAETILPRAVRIRLVVGPDESNCVDISSVVSITCRGETRERMDGDQSLGPGKVNRRRQGQSL